MIVVIIDLLSLLSVISKLLEKCVRKQLIKYLFENKLIFKNQFGFRSDLTTDDALFRLSNKIHKLIDKNKKILMVFIDLAKAFDSLNRKMLLKKLKHMGINRASLNWFTSYLTDREQVVSVNSTLSERQSINYGVIQGSTLGPLLFLIYINNLGKINLDKGEMYLYADDTALIFEGDTWDEVYRYAEVGLRTVKRWFDQNRLTINVGKTKHMAVSLRAASDPINKDLKLHTCKDDAVCNCDLIDRVECYKYLGVVFDNRLKWFKHINYINNKLRKCVYMFANLSKVLNRQQIKTVYYAYVQSILQYGIIAWGGALSTIIQPLQITQKSIIKAALQKPRTYPSDSLFDDFKVFDIRQLYIKVLACYAFKNDYNFLQETEHIHATRYQQQVGLITPRISKSINATNSVFLTHILFQNLPAELRNTSCYSLSKYKNIISSWLISLGRVAANRLIASVYVS